MQLNFGEAGESKYFYIFDTETRKLRKIRTNAPLFKNHIIRNKKELSKLTLDDGNYHKINIITDEISPHDIVHLSSDKVMINFLPRERITEETDNISLASIEGEIEAYFDSLNTDLDKRRLKSIAIKLVGG